MSTIEAAPTKPRNRLVRGLYLVLGIICVGFAYMSWLPGIPTFDFVILAAFFFARSSDRFHGWLTTHPVFGRIIRSYSGGGFSVRAKAVASAAVVGSLLVSGLLLTDSNVLRAVLAAVGAVALGFIWTRPTRAQSH